MPTNKLSLQFNITFDKLDNNSIILDRFSFNTGNDSHFNMDIRGYRTVQH